MPTTKRASRATKQGHAQVIPKEPLAKAIRQIIAQRDLTQAATAEIVNEAPSQISLLCSDYLRGFSADRLLRILQRLGYDVTITVGPASGRRAGRVDVEVSHPAGAAASSSRSGGRGSRTAR